MKKTFFDFTIRPLYCCSFFISFFLIFFHFNLVTISICTSRPGIVIGKGGQDVDKLKEELKDEYEFKSGSDCEILLPMYRRYKEKMFAMLDAEYAMIMYDSETGSFLAARDPIGIRPLFYGYTAEGGIIFASEAKNLVGLVDKIMPFPPGHYYKDGKFVCYRDITASDSVCFDDLETVCLNIHDKLTAGIEKRLVADAKVGFLLSGGLDSAVVLALAAEAIGSENIRVLLLPSEYSTSHSMSEILMP